ncbi:hypothetical protein NESM_000241000 [Novymonas esmeraldas]|uniref:Uncharacterized protein n=1 Tax=Novymonas esmeraldas TaxID=1808958 RepID=A0AAW0F7H7_9TRYP
MMREDITAPAAGTARVVVSSPTSHAASPLLAPHPRPHCESAADAHAGRIAREQHHMIGQLMGAGLVQPADLLEFGFSAAELDAAGVHLPQHIEAGAAEEKVESTSASSATVAVARVPRGGGVAPRKRVWGDNDDSAAHATTLSLPDVRGRSSSSSSSTAVTTPALTPVGMERAGEPQTQAKAITAPPSSSGLSERSRGRMLYTAALVGQTQRLCTGPPDCARSLCYGDGDAEDEGTPSAMPRLSAHRNTALGFSGLDVAVAKEIAQRLREECEHELDIECRRVQEYIESRKDGGTPYM